MNGQQLTTQKTALRQMLARLDEIKVSCHTCEHYSGTSCKKYEERPPESVIASGCEAWEFDEIPF